MKALFNGQEYIVIECYEDTIELEPLEGDEDQRFTVDYGDATLIIDPTDGDLDKARAWRENVPKRNS